MRVLIFSSVALFLLMHCIAQPKIVFADGKKKWFVRKGRVIEMKYEFVNEGNQPLILSGSKVEQQTNS